MGLREKEGDVGEGVGAFGGDAVGAQSLEEDAEDVVDVDLSEEIGGDAVEFAAKVVFLRRDPCGVGVAEMREAHAFAFGMAGEPAEVSVGVLELANVEGIVGPRAGHNGESIANKYLCVNSDVRY